MNIFVTDLQGVEHCLSADGSGSLMRAIRDAGLPIRAECGGSCVCATCHVRVDDAWRDTLATPSDEESCTLEAACDPCGRSRLSCQISLHTSLEGLRVALAKDWP